MTTPWDSLAQPEWNQAGAVASALDVVAAASTETEARSAYDRMLYALGNNHAGTYFPVALWALPHLSSLLRSGGTTTREVILDVLIDLAGSFAPEPGFERCVGPAGNEVDLLMAVRAGVAELRPEILACAAQLPGESRARQLAFELLELLDDLRSDQGPSCST